MKQSSHYFHTLYVHIMMILEKKTLNLKPLNFEMTKF